VDWCGERQTNEHQIVLELEGDGDGQAHYFIWVGVDSKTFVSVLEENIEFVKGHQTTLLPAPQRELTPNVDWGKVGFSTMEK
jgi:hypothetical protein